MATVINNKAAQVRDWITRRKLVGERTTNEQIRQIIQTRWPDLDKEIREAIRELALL